MSVTFPILNPLSARLPTDWTPPSLRVSVTSLVQMMPQIFADLASDAVPGFLYVNTLDLSQSQFDNLNTSPLVIIPAPGANKTLIPLMGVFTVEVTAVYSLNRTLRWRFNGFTTDMLGQFTPVINGLNRIMVYALNTQPTFVSPPNPPVNTPLEISLSGNPPGGGTIANARAQVLYTIASTPVSY